MEVTIKYITIDKDGVGIEVICNKCKSLNSHTITHATTKKGDQTIIDFSQLGNRCCHNFTGRRGNKTKCDTDYKLYK